MKKNLFFLLLLLMTLTMQGQTNGTLTVTTTTKSPTKIVKSRHVLAFWIEDSAGKLVNTMLYYNGPNKMSEAADLAEWWSHIGSFANKNAMTNVDALTSATSGIHTVRYGYWGKTVPLSNVPDGEYTVKLEMAVGVSPEGLSGRVIHDYKFTKGPSNSTGVRTRAINKYIPNFDTGDYRDTIDCFTNTTINWVPVATDINQVAYNNLFSLYPNPTKSAVYVNGVDIQWIEILSMDHKSLLKYNQPNIDLSILKPGIYLMKIQTAKGVVMKKVIKE